MCGIGGLISFTALNQEKIEILKPIIKKLFVSLKERGTDASGIATIHSINDFKLLKDPVSSEHLVKRNKFNEMFKPGIKIIMLHTRAATTGAKENNVNNHPFYSKETNSLLIHNGVISNYIELKNSLNLTADGECDSEIILRAIEKTGFNKAINKLMGSMAIGFMNGKTNEFILYKGETSPLCMAYLPELDVYLFASTAEHLNYALLKNESFKILGIELNSQSFITKYFNKDLNVGEKISFNMNNRKIKHEHGIKMKRYVFKEHYYKKDVSRDYTFSDDVYFKEDIVKKTPVDAYEEMEELWLGSLCPDDFVLEAYSKKIAERDINDFLLIKFPNMWDYVEELMEKVRGGM